jgi:quinol monooxygenase YgiN
MKNILFATAFLFLSLSAKAQSVQVKDLSSAVGSWEGQLTYLDYSSAKPFTMLANIKIDLTANSKGFIMGYEYPKEPHANSKDTTFIVGNNFGKDKIVEFKIDPNGDYKLTTEVEGIDGNDNKKAILRHTYHFKSNTFSIVKDVKFAGTDKWIKRNEYLLNRKGKAQDSSRMYRIAKIKVDASQIKKYKAALEEQMNAAIKLEPGVLSYTAVADKKDPTSITIFEVYANLAAYESHILTTHFKKYKDTVKDMVLSLELIDTDLVVRANQTNY